jgi:hypothetical protein
MLLTNALRHFTLIPLKHTIKCINQQRQHYQHLFFFLHTVFTGMYHTSFKVDAGDCMAVCDGPNSSRLRCYTSTSLRKIMACTGSTLPSPVLPEPRRTHSMTFEINPHSCQLNILIRRKLIFILIPIKTRSLPAKNNVFRNKAILLKLAETVKSYR